MISPANPTQASPAGRPARPWAVWVAEATFWAAACLGIWLLTLSSVNRQDLIVAGPTAVCCGALAVATRRAYRTSWRYPTRAGSWLLRVPAVLASDTVRVLLVPWLVVFGHRPEQGKFVRVAVAPGADDRARTRRAVALALVSMTPGTYVVHDDEDTGELVVHGLLQGGPSMHTVVTR